MTDSDKAWAINELTHRLLAVNIHIDAILRGSIPGNIEMFKRRATEFENRIEGLL